MNKERQGKMECAAPVSNERGAVAVMVALTLPVLLGFAALTIDIGQALVAKNELQDVADAGALAGARRLGVTYAGGPGGNPPPMTIQQQQNFTLTDPSQIRNSAKEVAALNYAAGTSITLLDSDIRIGQWNGVTKTFTTTNTLPNAVRVTARRDGSANFPISTFLASMWGINNVNVSASATASLTPLGTTNPGELNAPFGISDNMGTWPNCGSSIQFSPTPSSCAGWTTFNQSPFNTPTLRNVMDGLETGNSPATVAGQTSLQFGGGELAGSISHDLHDLMVARQQAGNAQINTNSSGSWWTWDVLMPVYQQSGSGCSNPSGMLLIVGYARATLNVYWMNNSGARVLQQQGNPIPFIEGQIICDTVGNGMGGGAINTGLFASVPGLVQ
jgi:Flp pilus assembly protein TadG